MTGPGGTVGEVTLHVAPDGSQSVRGGSVPDRVVSVVCTMGVEEWRRGWGATTPSHEGIISVGDVLRGAGSSTAGPFRRGDVTYTVVAEPVDVDRLIQEARKYVSSEQAGAVTLLVDDVSGLATKHAPPTVVSTVETLTGMVRDVDGNAVIGCSATGELWRAIEPLAAAVDRVVGVDEAVTNEIDRLRRVDPTTFGYAREYWSDACRGINRCERNYPQAKQIHGALEAPEMTPRILGATLSGLVELDVLDTWGETVGPTRYDLTAYDPVRATNVGFGFVSKADARSDTNDA